jgi:hypothetical protein
MNVVATSRQVMASAIMFFLRPSSSREPVQKSWTGCGKRGDNPSAAHGVPLMNANVLHLFLPVKANRVDWRFWCAKMMLDFPHLAR